MGLAERRGAGMKPGEKFLSVETWDMHGNAGIGIFEWSMPSMPFMSSWFIAPLHLAIMAFMTGSFGSIFE